MSWDPSEKVVRLSTHCRKGIQRFAESLWSPSLKAPNLQLVPTIPWTEDRAQDGAQDGVQDKAQDKQCRAISGL